MSATDLFVFDQIDHDGRRYRIDHEGRRVYEYVMKAPAYIEQPIPDKPALGAFIKNPRGVICVADVEPEPVEWLWAGRIPRGKVTVLDGDPGLGKSTVVVDLAARVSTGSPLATGERLDGPADVLLLSAEDGIADTIRPRLEAACAALDRVRVLHEVVERNADGEELLPRPPSIPTDLPLIEQYIKKWDIAAVCIDPLMAFLAADVDSHRDQDVRRALHALSAMADRTKAAVVIVRHLSKSGGAHPIYRGGGSIGIIGAARAGLLVAPDPQDDTRRILAVTKSNLAAMPPALAFRLVSDELHGVARIQWEGETAHRAADLLVTADDGEKGAIEEAVEFLDGLMVLGAVRARDAKDAASQAGIAARTLAHARKRMGITTRREGFGPGATWWWEPPIDAKQAIGAKEKTPGNNGEVGTMGPDRPAPIPPRGRSGTPGRPSPMTPQSSIYTRL